MEILQGKYDFRKDVITGERGQDIIIEYLNKTFGYKLLNKNFDEKYDFKMNCIGREKTFELKTDIYPRDTGNLVIEFECRGKPSGISVTKADYFVTYFPHFGEIWNIRTSDLKKLIDYLKPEIFEGAGDIGSNTRLYKLKKTRVRKFFRVHNI